MPDALKKKNRKVFFTSELTRTLVFLVDFQVFRIDTVRWVHRSLEAGLPRAPRPRLRMRLRTSCSPRGRALTHHPYHATRFPNQVKLRLSFVQLSNLEAKQYIYSVTYSIRTLEGQLLLDQLQLMLIIGQLFLPRLELKPSRLHIQRFLHICYLTITRSALLFLQGTCLFCVFFLRSNKIKPSFSNDVLF